MKIKTKTVPNISTLRSMVASHERWVIDGESGMRGIFVDIDFTCEGSELTWLRKSTLISAIFINCDFSNMDLSQTNFKGSLMIGSRMYGVDFTDGIFDCACILNSDFRYALFTKVELSHSYFIQCDFERVDFIETSIDGARFESNFFKETTLKELKGEAAFSLGRGVFEKVFTDNENLYNDLFPFACPEIGSFIGWKVSREGAIIKLLIPEDAKRSSATARKCRASKAVVLAIENADGTPCELTSATSQYDPTFVYTVGKVIEISDFDENRTHECAPGIHFFITRQEAINWMSQKNIFNMTFPLT